MKKRKMEESSAPSNIPPARQDVLSGLPDDILCHILSFLPTSQAMSTSVLSRRWRHLWKSVPSLDLRYEDFRRGTQPEFCWFVRQMLSMRDPAARPRWFHLRWREGGLAHHPQNIQCATSWVDRAMLTQDGDGNALLRRLELHLFSFIRFPLERILSCAAHVEHLSLATSDHCFCPVFERPPLLPKLRSLHLRRFGSAEAAPIPAPASVGSTTSLHRLIADHCPTLEDLTLEDCSLRRLRIFAPRLVRLAVVPDQPDWKGIDVEVPRLRSVRYNAMWRQKPWRLRLATRLVDASVHATFLGSAGLRRLADALDEGIRTLRSLELGFVESAMDPQQEEYPIFQNLKTLKLAIHVTEKTTQATVIFLLSHMPTLETLEIEYKEECGRPSQVEDFIKILKSNSKLPERVIVRQGGPFD